MYAVVHFTESDEVEVVPCQWLSLDQKVAFWPPYKDTQRIKAAVTQKAEPDETFLFFSIGTYEAARMRLKKAQTMCSLTSEEEGGKRMRM